ncbi:MAG: amidohydrolase family protein [Alphaproteobacteria bacterium]
MAEAAERRIDAHIHFWQLARGDYTALTPAMPTLLRDHLPVDLAPHLEAHDIGAIVVVQAAETVAETRFTLGLGKRWPFIAGVVGWVDPAAPDLAATLDGFCGDPRYKGVRPVRDDNRSMAWLADPALAPGLAMLAARGLSLDILVQHPDELPHATAIAARHPDLAIVLDHCGKPDIAGGRFRPWADDIAALARHGNVACKLSGLLNCARPGAGADDLHPYAAHVLACFGADRVMWASDWPPLTLAADYGRWCDVSDTLQAGLSPVDRAAVRGGTAARVYRL